MKEEQIHQKISEFLEKHKMCVVSTIHTNRNVPESAVVGFASTKDLKIVFGTSNMSRKYKNILKNPHVSLVVGWETGTIQYEGEAHEIEKAQIHEYSSVLLAKNPESKKFATASDQVYFLITPKWVRFLEHSGKPQKFELEF